MAVPFDQRSDLIWFDGKLVPTADCKISLLTHGLHYASCVFEGERAYGGEVFRGTEHSERLKRSAQLMDFEIPYSVAEKRIIRKTPMSGRSPGAAPSSLASRRRTTPSISPSRRGSGRATSTRHSGSRACASTLPSTAVPIRRRFRRWPRPPAST